MGEQAWGGFRPYIFGRAISDSIKGAAVAAGIAGGPMAGLAVWGLGVGVDYFAPKVGDWFDAHVFGGAPAEAEQRQRELQHEFKSLFQNCGS